MNARELLGIINAKERGWGDNWMLGLEAPNEDTLNVVIWAKSNGRILENSFTISGVSSLYTPVVCAEDVIQDMTSAMVCHLK